MAILAGDVGGTNTRLAIYARAGDGFEPRRMAVFPSRAFPTLDAIVRAFLAAGEPRPPVEAACLGVPGPVVDGIVRATNLPWVLEEGALSAALALPKLTLVNDHVATAAALPLLGSDGLITLHPGLPQRAREVFAVVAPGTGLGQAYLVRGADGRYRPMPSEGGHTEFAPRDEIEFDLLTYLQARLRKRVSVERVLSGPGLMNIYAFLRERRHLDEPDGLRGEIAAAAAPAAVVSEHGLSGRHPICVRTLDLFARLLGSQAGDVVLTYLSTGGLFLGGGIPAKVAVKLQEGGTVEAYLNKGRLSPVVAMTPLYVIRDECAALLGAAAIAAAL
jgi:glucokinase